MRDGRIGMRTGAGFLDYSGLDIDAYREQRLAEMVELLRHFGLTRPPVLDGISSLALQASFRGDAKHRTVPVGTSRFRLWHADHPRG